MRLHLRSVLLVSSILAAPAAFAQATPPAAPPQDAATANEADAGDTIVVTGSRISRPNFDSAQPASVLDGQQIETRGYTNVGEALQELPAFGVPGSNRAGDQAGSFGAGQTFVNFLGLGSQRTLTLVDGRRFVSSNTASIFGPTAAGSQVDFNILPTRLVQRVETIAVGGAPIYGSDAIAGTINVILRRDYEGFEIDGQTGISDRGDAAEYRIRGTAGVNFADGRGNFAVSAEYNRTSGLLATQRRLSALQRFFTTPADPNSPFDNVLIENRRIPALSKFGAPTVTDFFPLSPGQVADFGFQPSVTDAQGRALVFDSTGNLVPLDFGTETGNLVNFSGGNGFNLGEVSNLDTPTERYLATALASFQVTDNVRLFAEAWYANSKGTELADQPVYNTALFDAAGTPDGNLILSVDNPFLSPAARATILASLASNPAADAPPGTFYLGRANTDLVTGEGSSTVELYRFVGGVEGKFNLGDREFTIEATGNYGRSETRGRSRELVEQNFRNALNAVATPGGIVCAPGAVNSPVQTVSSTCAPINPFGQQISQAARDYVTTIATPRAVNTQKVGTVTLTGDLFTLPGGKVGISLGYEHREENASFDPGTFFFGRVDPANPTGPRTSFGRSVPIDPVSGRFNTDEVFGELRIPIFSPDMDIPLFRSLVLNGAIRYVDNSLAGGDPTYTVGAEWQPIRDITFRGNYTRSIRAPAITELFNPTSGIFTTADDPCDSRFINSGPSPATRAANCAAAGLPANFQSNIVDFTSRGSLSGNQGLRNEKANSWTVGAVLRPRFLPGFAASVDWIDIKLRDAVLSLDADQTLAACYDSPTFPPAICGQIDRDAGGQVTFIRTGFANAASFDYRGLIADVQWRQPTPFLGEDSTLSLGVSYQYIDKLEQRVGLGDLTTLRDSIGYSKHKGTANVTYNNQGFTGQVQVQYYGPAQIDPDASATARNISGVGDVAFINTSVAYRVNERFTLRLIVDNVLDTKPPFPAPGGGGTVTYFDGLLGRYFKVGATVGF